MRKVLFAFLLFALIILPLSANGNSEETESGVTTIQWWCPNWDEDDARELVSAFEAQNPDIKVELVITDWDTYKARTTAALTGKDVPELYSVLLTDVRPYAQMGLLAPVEDSCAAAGTDWSDILPAAKDIVSLDGVIYAVPFRYDGSGVLYNKGILREFGYDEFPSTWNELMEMCEVIKQDGRYFGTAWPFGNQTNAVTRFAQQLYTYGGNFMNDAQTEVTLDTEAAYAALSAIVDTFTKGYAMTSSLELDNTRLRDTFGAGNMAYYIGGPFDTDTIVANFPSVELGTTVIPGIDGMGCTTANGWCIVMGGNSENQEESARFLAFISQPENQAKLTDTFPASYKGMEDEKFSSEYLMPFFVQLENSKEEPSYTRWAEMEPIIYMYMQEALNGNISVKEACNSMDRDLTALLGL